MKIRLNQCFDSHVHLQGTGMVSLGLSLSSVENLDQFGTLPLKPDYFRQEWLTGFGWDQSKWQGWPKNLLPNHEVLDRYFSKFPVAFLRSDGHATWLNQLAMQKLGWWKVSKEQRPDPAGGIVQRDKDGFPTGVFFDSASVAIQLEIPDFSKQQKQAQFLEAGRIFNQSGFTHIRDMTTNLDQWKHIAELQNQEQLKLYIDTNFVCENPDDLERVFREISELRNFPSKRLRLGGVKLFIDGSLGSGGAFLSNGDGQLLWSPEDLKMTIEKVWKKNLPISLHAIGDQTSLIVAQIVDQLSLEGTHGELHLEHGQVLNQKSLNIFSKHKVVIHMQPCHWLSDKRWLQDKLGSLFQDVFPWGKICDYKIPLYFGSDSPIESPSIINNMIAVDELDQLGIRKPNRSVTDYHQHWDPSWGSNCWTEFEDGKILSVHFDDQQIV